MVAHRRLEPVKDASHLYEVERRARHAVRPGFHISELQLSPTQTVPWHFHTNIADTFYVLEGEMRLFLQKPKEEVRLKASMSPNLRVEKDLPASLAPVALEGGPLPAVLGHLSCQRGPSSFSQAAARRCPRGAS